MSKSAAASDEISCEDVDVAHCCRSREADSAAVYAVRNAAAPSGIAACRRTLQYLVVEAPAA